MFPPTPGSASPWHDAHPPAGRRPDEARVGVPGWPFRLPPVEGELLSSCLVRNALAHGSNPTRFLRAIWPGEAMWETDFDRDPAALLRSGRRRPGTAWPDDLAAALCISHEAVADATLAPWRAILGGMGLPVRGDTPLLLAAGLHHRTRTRHGLQFCPACLAGDAVPHFRKAWRLGFVVACPTHGTDLLDACPHCDAPVIPHRTVTESITDCHACGGSLARTDGTARRGRLPMPVDLQGALTGALRGAGGVGGPLSPGEAFPTVRALLAASAPPDAHRRLRSALRLPDAPWQGKAERHFEHSRHAVRAPWLETMAAWLAGWPEGFLVGAEAIGASQRTFARCPLPPTLAAQVARLPKRRRSQRRPWEPLLDEPVLRRLRRTDRAAYHAMRAERILAAVGRPGRASERADGPQCGGRT